MSISLLYTLLALAGALPFMACALLQLAGVTSLPVLGGIAGIASSYGFGIVSFLTGSHWSIGLLGTKPLPFNLFLSSNAVFLITWFAYVADSAGLGLIVQFFALTLLLWIDSRLQRHGVLPASYLRARTVATLLATGSLLLLLVTR